MRLHEACFKDNRAWFTTLDDARLYELDLKTGKLDAIAELYHDQDVALSYVSILSYGDMLILPPCRSNQLLFFDQKSHEISRVEIPHCANRIGNTDLNFFRGFLDGNVLFLFGFSYPAIVKTYLDTGEMTCIDSWVKNPEEYHVEDGCFHLHYCIRDRHLYYPFSNLNAVLDLDLDSNQAKRVYVGDENQRFFSCVDDGKYIWLFPRDAATGNIIKWDPVTKEEKSLSYPSEFERLKYSFFNTVNVGEYIYTFPHAGTQSLVINTGNDHIELAPDLLGAESPAGKYRIVSRADNVVRIMTPESYYLWEPVNNILQRTPYIIGEDTLQLLENDQRRREEKRIDERIMALYERNRDKCLMEGGTFQLREYLRYLTLL